MVDAVGGNAGLLLVEPCHLPHHLNISRCLLQHLFHSWELELPIDQSGHPDAAQLGTVKVRYTLNVANEGHVGYEWVDCPPASKR